MNLENISVLVFEILTRNYLKTNFIKIKFYIDYIADQKEKLFMLKLILPEEKYWQSFQEGLLEYKKSPSPYDIQGIKKAFAYERFADYKRDCEDMRNGKNLLRAMFPTPIYG